MVVETEAVVDGATPLVPLPPPQVTNKAGIRRATNKARKKQAENGGLGMIPSLTPHYRQFD